MGRHTETHKARTHSKMKFFIISIFVSATVAQQANIQNEEQGQAYMGNAYDSYYPAHAQGYAHEEPAFKPLQNRNGIEESHGYSRILKNMVFALGVLSIINLLLSTAAPGKRSLRADDEIVEDTVVKEASTVLGQFKPWKKSIIMNINF